MTTAILPPDKVRALLAKYAPPIRNKPAPESAFKPRMLMRAGKPTQIATPEQVREVRRRAAEGHRYAAIGMDLNMTVVQVGRIARGERHKYEAGPASKRYPVRNAHGNSRFSDSQIIDIRTLAAQGMTISELATKYQCAKCTISDIVRGLSYRHAGGPIRK